MLLAAVTFFTGCSDEEELGSRNAGKERPEVTVTPGVITDTKGEFSLSASGNTQQYGYVVLKGVDLEVPDALDILTNTVTNTVKQGAFNYADATSASVSFDCESEASYTVFAAAITSTGLVSKVKTVVIDVDDTIAPAATGFQVLSDNSLVILYGNERQLFFSQSSELQATVRYTKPGTSRVEGQMVISDPVVIPRENIVIEGAKVTFTVPLQPGATFLVDYPEGFLVDAAGNLCKAMRNEYNPDKDDFTAARGKTPAKPFDILPEYFEKPAVNTDWSDEDAAVSITFPFVVYDAGLEKSVRMAYDDADGLKYLNAEYTVTSDGSKTTVTVLLPQPPSGKFDVEITEGAFFDEWDNPTTAFSMKPGDFRYEQVYVIQTGRYLVTYAPLTDFVEEDILSETSGKEFILGLQPYDAEKGLYMIGTTWFNIYSHPFVNKSETTVINPVLLGKIDHTARTIVFDGSYLNPADGYKSIVKEKDGTNACAFGAAFYLDNPTKPTQGLVYNGGGENGKSPIVITFGKDGRMESISKCSFAVHNLDAAGERVAYFDGIWETGTLTYSPL